MGGDRADKAGVVAPPPLIYLAGLGLGFLLDALLPSASVPNALSLPVGIALIALGVLLQGTFMRAFKRARTPVEPWKPTTAIVTTGPYRFTRNPAYLGMALIFAGIAVLAEVLWAFAALLLTLAMVDRGVIAREERYLERKFGAEYLSYKARARRWL